MPYGARPRKSREPSIGAQLLDVPPEVGHLLDRVAEDVRIEVPEPDYGNIPPLDVPNITLSPKTLEGSDRLCNRPLSTDERLAMAYIANGEIVSTVAQRLGLKTVDLHALKNRNAEAKAILALKMEHTTRWEMEDVSLLTQDELLKRLMKAHDLASRLKDVQGAVAVIKEMAKILGYYAPEVRKVQLSVNGTVRHEAIRQLPDEELLRIWKGDGTLPALEGPVSNGEYRDVTGE